MDTYTCRECGQTLQTEYHFCPVCGAVQEALEKETMDGMDAFEEGEYVEALKLFKAVVKKKPFSAFSIRDAGHAAFHLQDFNMAVDYYAKALKIQPNQLDTHFNIGLMHMKRGHVNDAMFSFMETLHLIHPITPGSYYLGLFHSSESLTFQCHLNLGALYKERGELEKALEQYQLVIGGNPVNVMALGSIGECLMALERYDEAIKVYKKALKIFPVGEERLNIQNGLGIGYFKKGDLEKAVAEFKAVLKVNPGHVNAVYNLGQVYYHEGLTGRMKEDYEDFVKSSKDAASILFSISKSMVSVAASDKGRLLEESNLIGNSLPMRKIQDLIKRAAASDATVLILGENGTGKELVARAVHQQSGRHDKPFVPIACAALSESLLESELFGHEQGSFTGAIGQKKGKFEIADKGTIFLDEIGDISLATQVKLLRVLQEREFQRVGGNDTLKVNIRVICATNRNLKKAIQNGRFREDLFYRLNVIVIEMPPLREREGDMILLIRYFLERMRGKKPNRFEGVSAKALEILQRHRWPGNVRELENVIERIVTLNDDILIQPQHLPPEITNFNSDLSHYTQTMPNAGVLETVEKDMILRILKDLRFNKKRAANKLGISRPTLYQKMRKYGITLESK